MTKHSNGSGSGSDSSSNNTNNAVSPCRHVQVSLAIFTTYVMSSPDHVITADTAFVTLALMNTLTLPLSILPIHIRSLGQVKHRYYMEGPCTTLLGRIGCYGNMNILTDTGHSLMCEDNPTCAIFVQYDSWSTSVTYEHIAISVKQ